MKKPQGPCKGCTFDTGRSIEPNCHTTCEKYLAYKQAQEEWNKAIQSHTHLQSAMSAVNSARSERFAKRK